MAETIVACLWGIAFGCWLCSWRTDVQVARLRDEIGEAGRKEHKARAEAEINFLKYRDCVLAMLRTGWVDRGGKLVFVGRASEKQTNDPLMKEVVEAGYKALARKWHPDAGGDARKMRTLNEFMERYRK